jgi:hypothetical protein
VSESVERAHAQRPPQSGFVLADVLHKRIENIDAAFNLALKIPDGDIRSEYLKQVMQGLKGIETSPARLRSMDIRDEDER